MDKLIIFLFFVLSCQRNTNPISPDESELLFPETIGTTWSYSFVDTTFYIYYHDSINVETDTINIEIVSNKILTNGKKEIIWRLESKNSVDSLVLTYSSDTLFIEPNNSKYFTRSLVLLLPLNAGKKWKDFVIDYEVSTIDSLNLPSGNIKNIYVVQQLLKRECNSGGKNIFYIKKGIGIVKHIYGFWTTLGNTNDRKIWQLLNYSVPQ